MGCCGAGGGALGSVEDEADGVSRKALGEQSPPGFDDARSSVNLQDDILDVAIHGHEVRISQIDAEKQVRISQIDAEKQA